MINAYAAFEAGGELKPFEYDPGPLGSDQVEIDVEHCGVCYSDVSMLNDDWGFSTFPLVAGHEVIGTVAAVGDAVTQLEVGQRVGLGWDSGFCMVCDECLAGDHNLCASVEATISGPGGVRYGGFAEKVRASEAAVVPLPTSLDAKTSGPLFCGGITVFNPLVQFDIKPTDRVGVIGIGGLGHMALAFCNAWGCDVTAFTSSDAKRGEALELGAHAVIDSRDPDAITAAARSFDLILSTVNVPLDWNAYIAALKPKGRLHFVGALLQPIELQTMPMIVGQYSVSASPVGSPAMIAQMLDFAAEHEIAPVTEHFGFDQVNDALERLRSGKAHYRVVLSR